jgi:hypothetical protein
MSRNPRDKSLKLVVTLKTVHSEPGPFKFYEKDIHVLI